MKLVLSACLGLFVIGSFGLAPRMLESQKLSRPVTVSGVVGDVEAFQLSPDGQWVCYLADQDVFNALELFARRRDGTGGVTKLNGPLVSGGDVHEFRFTPDSSRVLYLADEETDGDVELFSAPVDGSSAAVKLNGPLVSGGDVLETGQPISVTSDGQIVIYLADQDTDNVQELYSVPVDGSAVPTPLVQPTANQDVLLYTLTPDDQSVLFTADLNSNNDYEIFKVPVDGSAAPVLVNDSVTAGTDVGPFEISPDGQWVVYVGDQTLSGTRELFSRPLDLSTGAIKLNSVFPPTADVSKFDITSASLYVVYQRTGSPNIYSAPIDGSASAIQLNTITGGSNFYRVSPAGNGIAFRHSVGNAADVYSVAIDGSFGPILLDPLPGSPEHTWSISPDGARVLLPMDGLYSVPFDGSGPPLLLSPPAMFPDEIGATRFAPDSTTVVYSLGDNGIFGGLYSVPLDGSAAPTLVSPPGAVWSRVRDDFVIDPSSTSVAFRGDFGQLGVIELFSGPLDASAPANLLNAPMVANPVTTGEVFSFSSSPDGKWVVYSDAIGFHSTHIDTPGSTVMISPPGFVPGTGESYALAYEIWFTPDSREVFFSITTEPATFLYRAPVDGSAPAELLLRRPTLAAGPLDTVRRYRLTPDGSTLLFEAYLFDYFGPPNASVLYSMPLDGSEPPISLGGSGTFQELFLSGDGTRAVYGASPGMFGGSLYSVPVDGSSAPRTLQDPFLSYWRGAQLDATGATVVYGAQDPNTFQTFLYSSPVDDSTSPVLLASDIDSLRANPATPDVAWWHYTGLEWELYHGATNGGGTPTLLSTVPAVTQVEEMIFTRDGSKLVYLADADVANQFELFVVPTDGSQAPVKINDPFVTDGSVTFETFGRGAHFRLSPDETRVIFRADARINNRYELWSAPLDGGGPTIILHNELTDGLEIHPDFILLSNSRDILYRGEPDLTLIPIWLARIDQAGPYRRRSGPFTHPTEVQEGFKVTAGEMHVLYRADEDTDGVNELYAFPIYKRQTSTGGFRGSSTRPVGN